MARTKNTRAARPAGGTGPAPAAPAQPGTAPAPAAAETAVRDALAAAPAATAAAIAKATGEPTAAVRGILSRLLDGGQVTKANGPGRSGGTWTLAGEGTPAADPPPAPAGDPAETDQAAADEQAAPAPDGGAAPAPAETEQPPASHDAPPAVGSADATRTVTDSDENADEGDGDEKNTVRAAGDAGTAAGEGAGTAAGSGPDPALLARVGGSLDVIEAAVTAARAVIAGTGDLLALRNALDEIREQAGGARRDVKAAAGGRTAGPASRPGELRDKVEAHLRANPGQAYTPHEIHKVISHSSGAIANALGTLTEKGTAVMATLKPMRWQLAPAAPAPASAGAPAPASAGEPAPAADAPVPADAAA